MTKKEALIIAARELAKQKFVGVQTVISPRMIITLGQAEFRNTLPFKLHLSEQLVLYATDDVVIDTIRHEVAHFMAGCDAGHGPLWKKACREVGARPLACGKSGDWIRYPLYVVCSLCWETRVGYCRPPRRHLSRTGCRKCGRCSLGKLLLLTADEVARAVPKVAPAVVEIPKTVDAPAPNKGAVRQLRLFDTEY